MLTHGIHNPVKQKFPNNLFSGSYRQVQMSIPHRAACLAEPLCVNVVSSLQEGDLHGADKGSMHGGAQRHTGEAIASKELPVVLLPLSPSDLPRVATPWAAATGASLSLHLTLSFVSSCCPGHWRCLLSHVPQHQAQPP